MSDAAGDEPERYPLPASAPTYSLLPAKVSNSRWISVEALLDTGFIVAAIGCTFWLALELLTEGFSWSPIRMLYLVVFWMVLAYLGLPRLHQLITLVYVPGYFIGRARTEDGLLGDPVNLALDGDADDIHAAMQRAGWTLADETTLFSAYRIVVSALFRRSYPEAPVSSLYLFGRRQSFAYQQEVDGSASQRHHVRFWPVPQGWALPGGHKVGWVAAATYDRSIGFSAFTMQITHKIDENIDVERDYIVNSLRWADADIGVEVIKDFSTAYHHRNGGGDRVRTDGDLPVLDVAGAAQRHQAQWRSPQRQPHDHGWPPFNLLVAGGLLLVQFALAFFVIGSLTLGGYSDTPQQRHDTRNFLIAFGIVTAVEVLLWLAILARHRWARLLLMLSSTGVAVMHLIAVSRSDQAASLLQLISCGTAVLMVLSISSDAVREWVMKGKYRAEVDLVQLAHEAGWGTGPGGVKPWQRQRPPEL